MRSQIKRLVLGLLGVIAFITAYILLMIQNGNLHEVIPGELYRSAQPFGTDIADYQAQHGIKTVINLRGEHVGDDWYDAEIAAAKSAKITHIDFPMAAKRELTTEDSMKLVEIMRRAPKPLLIHCKSGSDRTGLASALYLAEISKKDKATAARQLSLRYGHLSFYVNGTFAMDRTFERVQSRTQAVAP